MKTHDILKNKTFLYLTEFFAGISVMAVELGASRLLAPYFSSSQIVWTIIIATIMIAMALGNVYGGRAADKDPDPDKLYRRLAVAAVWMAAIPVLGKYIIVGISGLLIIAVNQHFLIWAGFLTCLVVFVFPCFLLGTTTPSLARYTTQSVADSGKTVGTLGAANTVGSIIGTFLPTFVTIPAVGTAATFLIFSGIILALPLIYFISRGAQKRLTMIAAVLFALCCVFGHTSHFAFWEKDLAYEGESIYNYLQVKDTPQSTILSTNVLFGVQSITMKSDEFTGMYYDYAMAAPLLQQNQSGKKDMLILGMGTGTYARQCYHYLGNNININGVEIDQKITNLSHAYFDAPKQARVTTYDGRAYLAADTKKYDVIMVDAYQDITIPFQMSSREFFTMVKNHLKPGGVMVVNMNMREKNEPGQTAQKSQTKLAWDSDVLRTSESVRIACDERSDSAASVRDNPGISAYLTATIASVFPHVKTADVPGSTNRELFASAAKIDARQLEKNTAKLKNAELGDLMADVSGQLVAYSPGNNDDKILTDDKAPVEVIGMRTIDSMISEELGYYKNVFKTQGIKGLIDSMS